MVKDLPKEIVYSSDNGGTYTKKRFMNEIEDCMKGSPKFSSLTEDQFTKALVFTYKLILGVIEWELPATYFDQFEDEDIEEILRSNFITVN